MGIYRCIFFSAVVCAALMPRSMLGFCTNMQETTLGMKNLQPKQEQGRTCRGLKQNKVQDQDGGRQEQMEVGCACFAGCKAMEKQSSMLKKIRIKKKKLKITSNNRFADFTFNDGLFFFYYNKISHTNERINPAPDMNL